MLCLPDLPDVEQVVLGEGDESGPVIDGVSEGMTIVDHSTISPTVTEVIAERLLTEDVELLDAPISGGKTGVIEGTLSITVGG
jgi:3-hydroxyisobutyrate dehydrogenase-like beta-hydroxyacid dehydrogenase